MMQKTISESMNTSRSKTKGSMVEVSDVGKRNVVPYLVFGCFSVIYGILILVYLPEALLNNDLGMLLTIFFMILLGMIFGLALFATNISPLFENLCVHLLLCWEKKSMKQLILKNMTVHRPNNKQTTIIYSLTVGAIIYMFLALAFQVQVLFAAQYHYGEVDMNVNYVIGILDEDSWVYASDCDPIL